jgi:hypothetical protein
VIRQVSRLRGILRPSALVLCFIQLIRTVSWRESVGATPRTAGRAVSPKSGNHLIAREWEIRLNDREEKQEINYSSCQTYGRYLRNNVAFDSSWVEKRAHALFCGRDHNTNIFGRQPRWRHQASIFNENAVIDLGRTKRGKKKASLSNEVSWVEAKSLTGHFPIFQGVWAFQPQERRFSSIVS